VKVDCSERGSAKFDLADWGLHLRSLFIKSERTSPFPPYFQRLSCRMLKNLLPIFAFLLLWTGQISAFSVSGKVTYEKVVHTKVSSGVSSVVEQVPVARAKVYNGSTFLTTTGADGSYSVNVTGAVTLTVKADDGVTMVGLALAGSTGMSGIYSATIYSGTPTADLADRNLVITVAEKSGAFNILAQFQRGLDWFSAAGQTFPSTKVLRVKWPDSGSYFEPDDYSLGFLGSGDDHDEFDDSVLLHEFGHVAMEVFSRDHSLGGAHQFTSKEDLRLSWSEGVANYLSCAMRGSAQYLDTSNYSPSNQSSGVGIYDDFSRTPTVKGSENEFAVAYVLWNAKEMTGGASAVVSTLASFKGLSEQISMDSFHDQWLALYPSTSLATIYTVAGMDYFVDSSAGSFSGPVTLTTASVVSGLTFFGKGNEDVFRFDPAESGIYIFSTQDTANGALTRLFLYDQNQTLLASNDQASNLVSDTTSKIAQSGLLAGGTYFLKVVRFHHSTRNFGLGANDGYTQTVGSYGSYSLKAAPGKPEDLLPTAVPSSSGGGGGGGCLLGSH